MKTDTKARPGRYPLLGRHERLSTWEKARGIWKNRTPDPIKELAIMRREWERTKSKSASK